MPDLPAAHGEVQTQLPATQAGTIHRRLSPSFDLIRCRPRRYSSTRVPGRALEVIGHNSHQLGNSHT